LKQSEALALSLVLLDALTERALQAEATATDLAAKIDALEKRELLLPEKGDPGEQGPQGEAGPAGEVDMEAVGQLIEQAVERAVAALPAPEKGERGDDGLPGEKGADGAPGAPGEAGKDGVGLADALIDKDGALVLTLTDGRTKSLGVVMGKDGDPGKDGADGITPTFIDAEFVGRTLRLKFDGERSCEFQLATPEYVGVFKEAETYEPGDMVSWAGSTWHCDEAKGMKPGAPDSGWTLAVKKGRDGKDAAK
jgi:hypothetical protein